jgi:hypothetical protein
MYNSNPISYLQSGWKYWNRTCFIPCTIIRQTSILQMMNQEKLVLHSYNMVTVLEKRLNAGYQSILNFHIQTCQILMVLCNYNIQYALYLFTPTSTCIFSQRQTSFILLKNNSENKIRPPLLFQQLKTLCPIIPFNSVNKWIMHYTNQSHILFYCFHNS